MWKKTLLAGSGLLLAAILTIFSITAVHADDGVRGPRMPFGGKVLDRTAQILGIDKQKLTDAIQQARLETGKQNLDDRFAKWVTDGKLTQEQAGQYQAWLAARPEGIPFLAGFDTARSTQMLDNLLKDERITQAQYDSFKSWLAQKPSFDLPKPEKLLSRPFTR